MEKLKFPEGFLWGAATSAHQVEGGNRNDWTEWEKKNAERLALESEKKFGHLPRWEKIKAQTTNLSNYISGNAAEHYSRFREDFDIAQRLGHTAHRFSIEWSRIEPEEGKFDEAAVEHYRKVLQALQERNMEPFVTLWHWTLPVWLAQKGGLENKKFSWYFRRYTEFVVSNFRNEATYWVTLNEPTSVIGKGFVNGEWPPQKKNFFAALRIYWVCARSHNAAFHAIHAIAPRAKVGLANLLNSFEPYKKNSWLDALTIRIAHYFSNRLLLNLTRGHHDFLAVQYYFHDRLKFVRKIHLGDKPETDIGWEIYPKGIYTVLKELQKYRLPVFITENGLADADDVQREKFIRDHLFWVHRAIREGVDVRGYFYWSLLDNFEWEKGFWLRFGLVAVDYATQERKIRPSAYEYAKICQSNTLEIEPPSS